MKSFFYCNDCEYYLKCENFACSFINEYITYNGDDLTEKLF